MFALLPFTFFLLSVPLGVVADTSDGCAPVTWSNPNPQAEDPNAPKYVAPRMIGERKTPIQPGDINCRYWDQTYDDPDSFTCKRMALKWKITSKWFFRMNPTLLPDCSNIEPHAMYCVRAFIEPLRSKDGFCGPKHNNATCIGTDFGQCCNAETWKCGETDEDCADGTCFEGTCYGDRIYSTDGTCGRAHRNRLCAGKWGDCCNQSGQCGTGESFCAEAVCQSGNCLPYSCNCTLALGTSGEAAPGMDDRFDNMCGISCNPGLGYYYPPEVCVRSSRSSHEEIMWRLSRERVRPL